MHDLIAKGLSFNIDCTLHWRDVFGGINVVNFSLREGDARELAPLLEKELLRSGRLVAFNHGQSRPE
ncbi:hypothetical protein [Mesorhizobium sp. WSM4904]|uniref:hypothetical protein n=1 Tax=Mesorhizobium sp. WSM4904 TaxID=3038545 RepID=UPI002418A9F5|nr:hypothetical protein [Mesorhizobium sp. WSM4904]WFP61608.1 hypothetical protein QAZ47_24485 [Mesorhizobium sp. WSM4904]